MYISQHRQGGVRERHLRTLHYLHQSDLRHVGHLCSCLHDPQRALPYALPLILVPPVSYSTLSSAGRFTPSFRVGVHIRGSISPVRNAASVARRSVRFRPAEWAPAAQPDWVRSAPGHPRGQVRARTPSSPHSTGAAGSMRPFAACRAHAGVPGRETFPSSVAPRSGLLSRGSSSTIMSSTHRRQRRRRPRRGKRLSRSGVTITTSTVAYRPAQVEGS